MPKSALPEHLQDIENNFPDDEQFGTNTWYGRLYCWYQKTTKTWFAFSYRCTEWWAKWRKYPKVLFAIGDNYPWRMEGINETVRLNPKSANIEQGMYLSRVQYYKRWHIAVQWPLMVSFHFYPNASDVPHLGEPRHDLDGKLWFGYWNHYDADNVYWMFTSIYLGKNWK